MEMETSTEEQKQLLNSSNSSITALVPGGVVTTQNISTVIRPKGNSNSLQFVKIQTPELSKKAVEQIRIADETKISKEKIKEVEEEWQNNLLSWKSKRRQQLSHTVDYEPDQTSDNNNDCGTRKNKTFAEMIEQRAKSGNRLSFHLQRYAGTDDPEEDNDEVDDAGNETGNDTVKKEAGDKKAEQDEDSSSGRSSSSDLEADRQPSPIPKEPAVVVKQPPVKQAASPPPPPPLPQTVAPLPAPVSHKSQPEARVQRSPSPLEDLQSSLEENIVDPTQVVRPPTPPITRQRSPSPVKKTQPTLVKPIPPPNKPHPPSIVRISPPISRQAPITIQHNSPQLIQQSPSPAHRQQASPSIMRNSTPVMQSVVSSSPVLQPSPIVKQTPPPHQFKQVAPQPIVNKHPILSPVLSPSPKTVKAPPPPPPPFKQTPPIAREHLPSPIHKQHSTTTTKPIRNTTMPPVMRTCSTAAHTQLPPAQSSPLRAPSISPRNGSSLNIPIAAPISEPVITPQATSHTKTTQPPPLPKPSREDKDKTVLSISGKKRCSSCKEELGRGAAAFVVESLSLVYHTNCFRCSVCHMNLSNGFRGVDVRVHAGQLHCQNCYSKDGLSYSRV